MYLNNINFPNEILDSIKRDKLVIFVGAGASMGAPTNLPDFEKLTKELAEDTGEDYINTISCEVFLGRLKAKGIPINENAAEILSGSCTMFNKLHEAIIDVFPNIESIKIVTTNFDQMFEKVFEARGEEIKVYDAPALPLGDDFHGIVHIHGNVNNPKYMVLCDDDFGKAYLTDGYASRFLVKLFESYTVLFIGYSYNDTITSYLTRAMSRYNVGKKYILTCDNKNDWEALGICPIFFPKNNYNKLTIGLEKFGKYSRKGFLEWKNNLSTFREAPSEDITLETEIDYCLDTIEMTRVLANSICGKEWINYLNRKKVFDGCFSAHYTLGEKDIVWANWLCGNFVGKEDDSILELICNHENKINISFAVMILKRIINNNEISNDLFCKYAILLEKSIRESWLLSALIEKAYERELFQLSYSLFLNLFSLRISLRGFDKKVLYDWGNDNFSNAFSKYKSKKRLQYQDFRQMGSDS